VSPQDEEGIERMPPLWRRGTEAVTRVFLCLRARRG